MIFPLFRLTLITFFLNYEKPSYVNIEWCTICTITMITTVIMNVKSFRKRHFWGDFNKQFLRISLLLWKKSVLHTAILCFYEILFFQGVIVMVKNKKGCAVRDTVTIKINFMHYRNYITWTRAKLSEVFEEFDMIYWLFISFH